VKTTFEFEKFEHRAPAPQNMLDIFASRWATNCEAIAPRTMSGPAPHFTDDPRPKQADEFFGGVQGKRILELGPMEAAHTWKLEQLGAREIVAVEANAEALLKCLIVKELSGLKNATFLYGDLLKFLETRPIGFDCIFCSGVLYHMVDPVKLIELMTTVSDKIFVWTHFVRIDHKEDLSRGPGNLVPHKVIKGSVTYDYFVGNYGDRRIGQFLGGNEDTCAWMTLDGIKTAFAQYGFDDFNLIYLEENHVNGPAVTFGTRRKQL